MEYKHPYLFTLISANVIFLLASFGFNIYVIVKSSGFLDMVCGSSYYIEATYQVGVILLSFSVVYLVSTVWAAIEGIVIARRHNFSKCDLARCIILFLMFFGTTISFVFAYPFLFVPQSMTNCSSLAIDLFNAQLAYSVIAVVFNVLLLITPWCV